MTTYTILETATGVPRYADAIVHLPNGTAMKTCNLVSKMRLSNALATLPPDKVKELSKLIEEYAADMSLPTWHA